MWHARKAVARGSIIRRTTLEENGMPSYTMRLLKCPACGGPLEPPAGQNSMQCTYCGNTVAIPENMRSPAPGTSASPQSVF